METQIKFLLIEHSPKREQYKRTIEKAGVDVELIDECDLPRIQKAVTEGYFDYVITDAFFLSKGQDHYEQTEEDQYCLPEIVNVIREVDRRLKIIVFTQFNDKIDYAHLDQVDYVFDKRYITSDLFNWQIKRFKESALSDNYREHTIISKLLEALNNAPELIWNNELKEMLQRYRNGINEVDQISAIKTSFIQIVLKCGFPKKGAELFEAIKQQEPLNIAGSPKKWGHLRHVINVFWLGYYIINNGLIDIDNLRKCSFRDITDESGNKVINKAWFIAALFHDIGHTGENVGELIKEINASLSRYPHKKVEKKKQKGKKEEQPNRVELVFDGYIIDEKDFLRGVITDNNQQLCNLLDTNHNTEKTDHGMLSAMTIYEKLYDSNDEEKKNFLNPALKAIALHNLFEKNIGFLKQFSFDTEPFVNLLILCDHLEMWDRDTGFESFDNDIPLEKIELREMNIKDQELHLVIDYQRHRALRSSDTTLTGDPLIKLLDKYFMPLLDNMKGQSMPRIVIKFLLDNRIELVQWPPPSN